MIIERLGQVRSTVKIIDFIAKFQETIWYPVLFALLCMFAASFGMAVYIPIFWVMASLVIFSALFSGYSRTLFVPIIMSYYAMGRDVIINGNDISQNDMLGSFTVAGFANMIIAASFMFAALMFRLVCESAYLKKASPEKFSGIFSVRVLSRTDDLMTLSLIVLSVACMLNGLFSAKWEPLNLVMGFLLTLGFLFFYFVSRIIIAADGEKAQGGEESCFWKSMPPLANYVCVCFMALGLAVGGEILFEISQISDLILMRNDAGIITGLNRTYTALGWGIYNLAGAVMTICFGCTLYLSFAAKKYLGSVCYFLIALIILCFVIITNCRDAIFSSVIILALFILLSLICPGKRLAALSFIAGLALISLIALFALKGLFESDEEFIEWLKHLFRLESFFSGRMDVWVNAMSDFKESPAFGIGFMDGGFVAKNGNIYSNMYHNIGIQALASMGVFGAIALIIHAGALINMGVRNCCRNKVLFTLLPFLFILISIVDNYFWYLNVQVLYCVVLAVWSDTQKFRAPCRLT